MTGKQNRILSAQFTLRALVLFWLVCVIFVGVSSLNPTAGLVFAGGGGAIGGSVITRFRYHGSDAEFTATVVGGAIGGLMTSVLVIFVLITCSTLFMYATDTWPEPEEVYVGFWDGMMIAIFFYGGGAFLIGGAVGVLVWFAMRIDRLRARLAAMAHSCFGMSP